MTWEELKEEAKKMGYNLFISKSKCDGKEFDEEAFSSDNGTFYQYGFVDMHNIKPDQMLAIMKALQQEVDDERQI